MSYLVLARKHRPATFEQVVGQEHITKTLAGALASGRLAHAFCFTGPRGVGKTSAARILAKALNCVEGPTPTPCGKCTHCVEIDEGRSLDVQEIDAASNSRVEDVRELREMIRYRPQAARHRVTILDEVHMLSKPAFNALLKTLEEPPEHAVFILATTDVHKVPLTILSRCQRYDFRRLSPQGLARHLGDVLAAEGCSLPPESLILLAREADGSVRDSLSLLDQVLSSGRSTMTHQEVVELLGLVDTEMVRQTARAILAGRSDLVLDYVGQVYGAGGEMQSFYAALQEHFRNLAAALAAPAGAELFGLTAEELAELKKEAQAHSPETLHEVFRVLAQNEELFRRAGQPRLVMEMTLLQLTQVRPVLSLEQILARLEQVAAGAEPPAPVAAPVAPVAPMAPAPRAALPAEPAPSAPAPAPQAAPTPAPTRSAGGGMTPRDPEAALRELAEFASHSEPLLASCLSGAQASQADGTLALQLPGGYKAQTACQPENREKLADLARQLWGPGAALKLTAGQAAVEAREDPARQQAAQELASHPAVLQAMEVFEAQVVELDPELNDEED